MAISNTGTGPPPKGAPGYLRLRLRNDRLRAAGWRTVAWQNGGGLTQDVSWPEALAPLRCGQPAPGLTRPGAGRDGPGALPNTIPGRALTGAVPGWAPWPAPGPGHPCPGRHFALAPAPGGSGYFAHPLWSPVCVHFFRFCPNRACTCRRRWRHDVDAQQPGFAGRDDGGALSGDDPPPDAAPKGAPHDDRGAGPGR